MKIFLQKTKEHKLLTIIIIAVIFGLAGGTAASLIARSYLISNYYNFPLFGNIDFSKSFKDQGLIIRDAKMVVVEQNAKINEIIASVNSGQVGIFKKIPLKTSRTGVKETVGSSTGSVSVFDLNNFYKLDQPLGQGFIITSDGWIITSFFPPLANQTTANKTMLKDYIVLTKDKKIYSIDDFVKDNLTPFNFLHVQASDFPVRKFSAAGEIKSGNLVLAVNWAGSGYLSSLIEEQKKIETDIVFSDSFFKRLILADNLPENFRGSVIFNLGGDIMALIDNLGEIRPINQLEGAINSLLKNKTVNRASLGVNYIDLKNLAVSENTAAAIYNSGKGAIIYKPNDGAAVIKNGAADKAGLKEGDIILSVNDIELNKDNNLTDVVQRFIAGDKIRIIYWRENQQKQVDLILGQIK